MSRHVWQSITGPVIAYHCRDGGNRMSFPACNVSGDNLSAFQAGLVSTSALFSNPNKRHPEAVTTPQHSDACPGRRSAGYIRLVQPASNETRPRTPARKSRGSSGLSETRYCP